MEEREEEGTTIELSKEVRAAWWSWFVVSCLRCRRDRLDIFVVAGAAADFFCCWWCERWRRPAVVLKNCRTSFPGQALSTTARQERCVQAFERRPNCWFLYPQS